MSALINSLSVVMALSSQPSSFNTQISPSNKYFAIFNVVINSKIFTHRVIMNECTKVRPYYFGLRAPFGIKQVSKVSYTWDILIIGFQNVRILFFCFPYAGGSKISKIFNLQRKSSYIYCSDFIFALISRHFISLSRYLRL